MDNRQPKTRKCECGAKLVGEAAEFWGECEKCRLNLPIRSSQHGDSSPSGAAADRQYHGGLGSRGEW